jgi:hypothetical protein
MLPAIAGIILRYRRSAPRLIWAFSEPLVLDQAVTGRGFYYKRISPAFPQVCSTLCCY